MTVYHYSSTLHLPWIIRSGQLQPTLNRDVGIGETRLLWGTTDSAVDETSAAVWTLKQFVWFSNLFNLVRFTLPAEGFLTWKQAIAAHGWSAEAVARMVGDDHRRHGRGVRHTRWRVRRDPLPLAHVIKAEISGVAWQPIPLDPGRVIRTKDPDCLAYRLAPRKIFYGVRKRCGEVTGDVTDCIYLPRFRRPSKPSPPVSEEERQWDAAYVARLEAADQDSEDQYPEDWP